MKKNTLFLLIRKQSLTVFLTIFFVVVSILPFWKYFVKGEIPFNGNYLVSAYEPFKTETVKEFKNGLPSKPFFDDQLRQYFPYLEHARRSIAQGKIPWWNPYQFSGVPFAANWQTAVYFPTNILFLFFKTADYWSITRIIPFFLALAFTHLFFKKIKTSNLGSIFGAVLFAFSGTFITYSQETIYNNFIFAFLPLALFLIEKYLEDKKKISLLLLLFVVVLIILTGFIQQVFYSLLFIFLYSLLKIFITINTKKTDSKTMLIGLLKLKECQMITIILCLSIIICLPFLIPGFIFYFQSARSVVDYSEKIREYLLPIYAIFTYIFPDYLGNPGTGNWFGFSIGAYHEKAMWLAPSYFIFFTIFLLNFFAKKQKFIEEKFFLSVFVATLIFTFKNPISYFISWLKIPIIGTAMFNRIIFINTFALVYLTVLGFEQVLKNKANKKVLVLTVVVVAITVLSSFCFAKYYSGKPYQNNDVDKRIVSIRNMIIPTVFFAITSLSVLMYKISRKKIIFVGIIFASILYGYYFFNKYVPFSERKYFYPENPLLSFLKEKTSKNCRAVIVDPHLEYVLDDIATFYQIQVVSGYDPLNFKKYNDMFFYLDHPKTEINWRRYDAGIDNLTFNFDKKIETFKRLNVCVIVTSKNNPAMSQLFFQQTFKQVFKYGDFLVWSFK